MPLKPIYTAQMKTPISEDFRRRNEEFAVSLLTAVRDGSFPATFTEVWCPKSSDIYAEMNVYKPPLDDDVFIYNLVDGIFRTAATASYIPKSEDIIALAQPLEDAARAADKAAAAATTTTAPKPKGRPPGKKAQAAKQKEEKARLAKEEANLAKEKAARARAERAKEREEREVQGVNPREDQTRSNVGGRVKKEKPAPAPTGQSGNGPHAPMELDHNNEDTLQAHRDELNALIARQNELQVMINEKASPEDSTHTGSAARSQKTGAPAKKRKRVSDSDTEEVKEVPDEPSTAAITGPPHTGTRTNLTTARNAVGGPVEREPPARHRSAASMPPSASRLAAVPKGQVRTNSVEPLDQDSDASEEWIVRRPALRDSTRQVRRRIQSEEGSDVAADDNAADVNSIVDESVVNTPGDQDDASSPIPSQFSDNEDVGDMADPVAHQEVKATRGVTFAPLPAEASEEDASTKRQHARECPMPEDPKEDDVLPKWVPALFPCDRCKQVKANCYINIAHSTKAKTTSRACGFCSSGKYKCSHTKLAINMVSLLDAEGVHSFIDNVANDIVELKEGIRNLLEMKTLISSVLKNMVTTQDFAGFRQDVHEVHNRLQQDTSDLLSAVRTMRNESAHPIRRQQRPSPAFTFKTSTSNTLLTTPLSTPSTYTSAPLLATSTSLRQSDSIAGSTVPTAPLMPVGHTVSEPEPSRQRWSMSPVTVLNRLSQRVNDSVALPIIPEREASKGTHEMDAADTRGTPIPAVALKHSSPSPSTDGDAQRTLTDYPIRSSVARTTPRSNVQPHLVEDVPIPSSGIMTNHSHHPQSALPVHSSLGFRLGTSGNSVSREQTISPLIVPATLTAASTPPLKSHVSARPSPAPRLDLSRYPLRGEGNMSLLKVPTASRQDQINTASPQITQGDMQMRGHHSSSVNDPFPRRNGQIRTVSTDDASSNGLSVDRLPAASHTFTFKNPMLNDSPLVQEPIRPEILGNGAEPFSESRADPQLRNSRILTHSPPMHPWSMGAALHDDDDPGAHTHYESAIASDLDHMPIDAPELDIGTERSFD